MRRKRALIFNLGCGLVDRSKYTIFFQIVEKHKKKIKLKISKSIGIIIYQVLKLKYHRYLNFSPNVVLQFSMYV